MSLCPRHQLVLLELESILHCNFFLRNDLGDLEGLKESISTLGLLQPIVVRKNELNGDIEIISGHRRYDACRELGFKTIPCYIVSVSNKEAFEIALTENIQRESLTPLEEAEAFRRYVDEHGYGSVSELARVIARSEVYVSQKIALLSLPVEVRKKLQSGRLTASQAQELIWLNDEKKQVELSILAEEKQLTVRQLRGLIRSIKCRVQSDNNLLFPTEDADVLAHWKYRGDKNTRSNFILTRSIQALRNSMVIIDSLIDSIPKNEWTVYEFVLAKRFEIHEMIDQAIRLRLKNGRNEKILQPIAS